VRLTAEEKRLYGQLFRIADTEQIGVITGSVAVEFFKKSRLSPAILAEVPFVPPFAFRVSPLMLIPGCSLFGPDRRYGR
jgi:hypothetical protein